MKRAVTLEFHARLDESEALVGVTVITDGKVLAEWTPAGGLTRDVEYWPLLLGELGALCCSAFVQLQAAEADGETTR